MEYKGRVWKDIPEFDGRYQASRDGCILAVYANGRRRALKPFLRLRGADPRNRMALFVCLKKPNGMRVDYPVISLVARTWVTPCPEGMIAIQRDGNIQNLNAENVMYVSRNQLDRLFQHEALRAAPCVNVDGRLVRRCIRYRRAVLKVDSEGRTVERYASIHDAARANYMSDASISGRCNGLIRKRWADDGTTFRWEDIQA